MADRPPSVLDEFWRDYDALKRRVAELESEASLYRAALERIANAEVPGAATMIRYAQAALKGDEAK